MQRVCMVRTSLSVQQKPLSDRGQRKGAGPRRSWGSNRPSQVAWEVSPNLAAPRMEGWTVQRREEKRETLYRRMTTVRVEETRKLTRKDSVIIFSSWNIPGKIKTDNDLNIRRKQTSSLTPASNHLHTTSSSSRCTSCAGH